MIQNEGHQGHPLERPPIKSPPQKGHERKKPLALSLKNLFQAIQQSSGSLRETCGARHGALPPCKAPLHSPMFNHKKGGIRIPIRHLPQKVEEQNPNSEG